MSTIYIGLQYECYEASVAAIFRIKEAAENWADAGPNRSVLAFADAEGEVAPHNVFLDRGVLKNEYPFQ